ncbi:hypothetical protein ACJRO7_020505 [Eucalyptus globulus]|uniref:Xylanase inhibitor N-terminal domain-containing protein n=1 Tax=Eucalyptus globulus TaxID=34317 RepID=A0ABD3KGQ3_EUCGL
MNFWLENPRVTIMGIADRGSDLIWRQCKTWTDCFKQASLLFDPRKSWTYKDIPCHMLLCRVIDQTSCRGARLCEYPSRGDLHHCVHLRQIRGTKVLFGFGQDNDDDHMSGILGLEATGRKSSYCLVTYSSDDGISSKLNFWANAMYAGCGVTFYYLTLEVVSVSKTRIEFTSDETFASVDLGPTLTPLPYDFYTKIEAAMVKGRDVCRARHSYHDIPFRGRELRLSSRNTFVRIANVICFAVNPGQMTIYGNFAQMDYLGGYDTQHMKLSFMPVDCPSHQFLLYFASSNFISRPVQKCYPVLKLFAFD